jgi:uncharacterized protein (DUF58 family)
MNAKSNLVFLLVLGLFLASLLSRVSGLAWMTVPFLFYLGAGLLTTPQKTHLSALRTLSHENCESGSPVTMTLSIKNHGPNIARLRVSDPLFPNMQVIDGEVETVSGLSTGEKVELLYQFSTARGKYKWDHVRVTTSDPFGLFEKSFLLSAPAHVFVLPAPLPANRVRLHPPHTLRAAGPNLSRLPGSGVDFFGVRQYHTGDSLRSVNWRLSARHPRQFFTKEFEREEMADIGIILDGSAAININDGQEDLFEYSVRAAAALAKSLLQMGNRISLLALGERVERVFPGTGKRQLAKINHTLAVCRPGEKISLDTLKYLPVKLFPSHSLIVVISPLRKLDFMPIARLRADGYQVLAVSPDPVRFSSRKSHSPLAVRAAQIERAALLWRIRSLGVHAIDWSVEQPLFNMIRADRWTRI